MIELISIQFIDLFIYLSVVLFIYFSQDERWKKNGSRNTQSVTSP